MRYDRDIYLQTITQGTYDPQTGNYTDDTVTEVQMWANVMDTSAQSMTLIYGGLKQGSLTAIIQGKVPVFDYIRVGTKKYCADSVRVLRTKTTITMSEVQGSDQVAGHGQAQGQAGEQSPAGAGQNNSQA